MAMNVQKHGAQFSVMDSEVFTDVYGDLLYL